jgi:hypothetical protein
MRLSSTAVVQDVIALTLHRLIPKRKVIDDFDRGEAWGRRDAVVAVSVALFELDPDGFDKERFVKMVKEGEVNDEQE